MSAFSIIIPTYNNPIQVKRCIQSIINNFSVKKNRYEIIVVDDASKNKNYKKIKKFIQNCNKNNLCLIRNKKNSGPAQSRNIGVKKAKFENLLFLDSDTILHKDISKRLKINLMHIEAGLRSDVIDMPEEQNRYISDYLSDFLIAPTNIAFNNLKSFFI